MGRNTFYYHFEDKYDLVNWYFQSGITQFLVERSAYSSWDSLLTALEAYFLENKVFYCNALAYNGQNSLQQYMFDYLRPSPAAEPACRSPCGHPRCCGAACGSFPPKYRACGRTYRKVFPEQCFRANRPV